MRGCRDTSPVQRPPCVSSRATNRAVSYSDREFSPLGALSRMVSERTLTPFLYLTYWHTPPLHRSSPLSLKARCCLATSSKTPVVQLAQYNKSIVAVCLSSNMADRKLMKQTFNSMVCFALTSACMCLCTYVSTSSTTHFSGTSKVRRVSSYRSVEEGGPGGDDRCNA